MKMVYKTDVGKVRTENQDNFRAAFMKNGIVWAIVCDGMGGTTGGAVASKLVCDTVENYFAECYDESFNQTEILSFMRSVLDKANETVYSFAKKNSSMFGMGTTAVLTVVDNNMAYFAHIGDSRAYMFSKDTILQVTRDHSKVQELVEKGSITEEEAYSHPNKNLITRAIGVAPLIQAEYNTVRIKNNDIVLLCTDGLSNYITSEELKTILHNEQFFDLANILVDKALDCGGSDNITVLLAKAELAEDSI